jgi:predicted nuclease of predicted toxin-antitoxin system
VTLRLLIDEPVNGFVGRALAEHHDTLFAVRIGLSGYPDTEIARRAAELDRLVVTQDRGFPRSLIGAAVPHPGIIVLELEGLPIDERMARALDALEGDPAAFANQLTIIRKSTVRRRTL